MNAYPLLPSDIFHLLQGHWLLERTIPGQATMRGQVTVTSQATTPGDAPNTPPTLALPAPQSPSSRPQAAARPQWRDLHLPATEPETLRYTEQVHIQTTTGHHLTGAAHYLFTHHPNGSIDVHLPATGTLFHTLHFTPNHHGHLEAQATHHCAADTYASTYRILSPTHLYIEHRVHGPHKHYTSETTLTRNPL